MANQSLYLSVEGASTLNGGFVRVKNPSIGEPCMHVALVGDDLVYPDGSVPTIMSCAGFGMMFDGKPVALMGSDVSGNERIIGFPDNSGRIGLEDGQWIEGLFDSNYVSLRKDATHG